MNFLNNFEYLDRLIHSGEEEIILDSDIILSDIEESEYLNGLILDVDGLVIDGNGHEINANGKTRIFNCVGKNITIKNLTLKEGYANTAGGAILNYGKLTIIGSIISENTSEIDGGAIFNDGGKLTIRESILSKNKTKNGGAIFNDGGKLTIIESTFTKNYATGNPIKKSKSNKALGGSIYNHKGDTTIIKSLFKENKSHAPHYAYGGAIFNNEGELIIRESILRGNTVKTDFKLTEYLHMGYYAYGGAIYNFNKSNLKITESTIAKNTACGDGGGIYNSDDECILTIKESTIIENKAKEDGGGIFNYGELTILKSKFIRNRIEEYYDNIRLDGGFIKPEPPFTTNPKKAYGAICNMYEKNVIIENCTFEYNRPTFD